MDQRNGIKEAIDDGRLSLGIQNRTGSPVLIELYGNLGFDWVWIDFEHKNRSPWDGYYMESLSRTAECANTELIVRVPKPDQHLIRKVLDSGIRNVIVPRIETAEEIRTAIEAARFEYEGEIGERGAASGRARGYGTTDDPDYPKREDENVLVGATIEKREALENIDEILSVPELGFVSVGTGDLSFSLGHPMEYDHPEVLEAARTIWDAANEHGVTMYQSWGIHFSDLDGARRAIDDGARMLKLGQDWEAIKRLHGERLTALREYDRSS